MNLVRVNIILALLVAATAFLLVASQHQARQTFVALEKAKHLAQNLETQRNILEVEKRAESAPAKIEKIAREKLGMQTLTTRDTYYVRRPMSSSSATGQAGGVEP